MAIKLIFAYGAPDFNRLEKGYAFGNGNGLPWPPNKDDMEWFKEDTKDSVLLMGANTWKSLWKHLPGRVNAVMSRYLPENKTGQVPDQIMHGDLYNAIHDLMAAYPEKDICIIGGKSLLAEGIEFADEIIATRIELRDPSEMNADVWLEPELLNQIDGRFVLYDTSSIQYLPHNQLHGKFKQISRSKLIKQ